MMKTTLSASLSCCFLLSMLIASAAVRAADMEGDGHFDVVGDTLSFDYNAAECVDLTIFLADTDGLPDDGMNVYLNGVLVLEMGGDNGSTVVSLCPGDYVVDIVYVGYFLNEGTEYHYELSESPFTSDYVIPELLDCPVPEVAIDIKPWSDPNSINSKSNGVIPVAILGGPTLDVTSLDPATIEFGPGGATPVHDMGSPDVWGHVEDANGDGYLDLVLHFRGKDVGLSPGDTEATLTGVMEVFCCCDVPLELLFEATDAVNVVK